MVITLSYQKRKADGQLNGCCPQSIAFGDPGEIQQGWFKKSWFFKNRSLLFVDLYHFVVLLRCWGKAADWQSELTVTGHPTCVSALNPNCSLGFSPLGVCRLWNLICSGWGNVRGTLNGRRRQIKGKCKYIPIKIWIILDERLCQLWFLYFFIVGNCSDSETWWSLWDGDMPEVWSFFLFACFNLLF